MSLKVMFFPNGNTAAFKNGQQVPDLQEPWLLLYVQLLAAVEIDPTEVEFTMPDRSHARVFERDDGGYNWRFD